MKQVADGSSRIPLWANQRARLMMPLACLAVLVINLVTTSWNGFLGIGNPSQSRTDGAWAVGCPARDAPSVASVSPGYIAELQADMESVMRGRHGRLYSLGVVTSENAWSDNYPQPGVTLPKTARIPGAYEIRWWAPNRDDVVADVFVFAQTGQARRFFERASSARCRPASAATSTSSPPNAQNLMWRNPDDVFQEDVYLLRANRVYRVSDVRARSGQRTPSSIERKEAFSIVDHLACALPEADCRLIEPLSHVSLASSWQLHGITTSVDIM